MGRIVVHLDLDAFYAACEELRNPSLKGKPVVIGADPKEGKGRGVVATCNYLARKFGIHSGMPITWAYRRCPKAEFLPVDMVYYVETSKRVMSFFKEKSKKFEQTSIDEAFLDLSEFGYGKAENIVRKIKADLRKKEGLTCSAGIAPNMLIAKIASDFQKPNGLTLVKPYEIKMFLFPLPIRTLPGIGPKMGEALKNLNINSVGKLASTPIDKLQRYFGKVGVMLKNEALGKSDREVGISRHMKSMSRQATFLEDTYDKSRLKASLEELVHDVLEDAKANNLKFRTITIKVRYSNFDTHTKQRKFKSTLTAHDARAWASELLKPFMDGRKIRLLGFGVSDLVLP